jgi:hypothetical protein
MDQKDLGGRNPWGCRTILEAFQLNPNPNLTLFQPKISEFGLKYSQGSIKIYITYHLLSAIQATSLSEKTVKF